METRGSTLSPARVSPGAGNPAAVVLETAGHHVVRYGLVVVLAWIGAMKFTTYEATSIQPLVASSPVMGWLYQIASVQAFSNLLGVVEIAIAVMIALRPVSATVAALGSALAVGMFLTTLSFLVSTPGWESSLGGFPALSVAPGQFLLKDVVLLGAALWSLGEALAHISDQARPVLEWKGAMNMSKSVLVLAAAVAVVALSTPSQGDSPAPLNDLEMAHVAYTADSIDIRYAHLALGISKDPQVRVFAETMIRDHAAVNDRALALLKKLEVAPADNALSRQLATQADAVVAELRRLDGREFDRRYAANELRYHRAVNRLVEGTFIPNLRHPEVKALFAEALVVFKAHEQHAQHMVDALSP